MPTVPHEVIVVNVVYSAVLLVFGQNIALFPVMVGCIQRGLRALTKKLCKVEALVGDEGNMLIDQNDDPKVKMLNPRVKLPYAYLVTWYDALSIPGDSRAHIRRLCAIPTEVRALDLAA